MLLLLLLTAVEGVADLWRALETFLALAHVGLSGRSGRARLAADAVAAALAALAAVGAVNLLAGRAPVVATVLELLALLTLLVLVAAAARKSAVLFGARKRTVAVLAVRGASLAETLLCVVSPKSRRAEIGLRAVVTLALHTPLLSTAFDLTARTTLPTVLVDATTPLVSGAR